MNKLEELALNESIKRNQETVRQLNNNSDNLSDLIMYVESNGNCEVSNEEAILLITALKQSWDESLKQARECDKWQLAMLCQK